MNPSPFQRTLIFGLLLVLMAATRVHHFDAIPDASWAAFFIGGFYLGRHGAWAFAALLALAVLVDAWVINAAGIDFWSHYCVSPGYWLLAPAYFSMWLGGRWMARGYTGADWPALGRLLLAVVVATAACHLISQAGFYWLSNSWTGGADAVRGLDGWWKNYTDWLLPHPDHGSVGYLVTTGTYVALAAAVHLLLEQASRLGRTQRGVR